MKLYIYPIIFILFLFVGCTEDEDVMLDVKVGLKDEVSTRAVVTSSTSLTTNGVGVFLNGTGYTPAVSKYTTTFQTPLYLGSHASVYGFYPHTTTLTLANNGTSTLPVVLNTSFATFSFDQTDYMYATANPAMVTKISPSTVLTFNHVFARVSFIINRGSTFQGTGTLTSFVLTRLNGGYFQSIPSGTMKISDGTLTGLQNAANITVTGSKSINDVNGTAYTIDLLAAPISNIDVYNLALSLIIDGKTYTMNFPSPVSGAETWVKNKHYTYTITVNGNAVNINSVTIEEWGTAVNKNVILD